MSVPPRFRSVNSDERDFRSVLGPTGNKLQRKPPGMKLENNSKKMTTTNTTIESKDEKKKPDPPASPTTTLKQCSSLCSSLLRRRNSGASSMTASYSSDASSSCESSHLSVASSSSRKKAVVRRSGSVSSVGTTSAVVVARRKQLDEKEDKVAAAAAAGSNGDCFSDGRRRCAWITPKSDPCYVAFHDEEWGVPVHDDDKKLFELLCLSGALSELSWTDILSRRQLLREVFMDFDPVAVSKLNEKTVTSAISLLSEVKLRSILDNARQVRKIVAEYGSFKKYMWNFVSNKPTQSQFRYQRQVPVKTSKAEFISKDLVRRGFRSVSPTVIYSFMQAAGLTNDHLIGCFRYQDCCVVAETTATKAKKTERE